MSSAIKITVVTPTFNSVRTVRETLESVARQRDVQVEHIVMDGGSTDGTLEILKEFPHLNWFSEKDEGHYHAMNKGIVMATGEVVAILNADDCYCEGILAKVAEALAKHPEWDALFGDVIFVDGEGKEIYRREEACWDAQIVRFGFCLPNHQALFVRKRTYDRLGLLRHKHLKNICDYDFILRMALNHCCVGHLAEYIVRYRYHQFGQSADARIVANMFREHEILRREYGLPRGLAGWLGVQYARIKRQAQKLRILGKCDLIPGRLILRRHTHPRTQFSSNIGLDKLEG